jgi:membrane-associated phospholipid phosphatase
VPRRLNPPLPLLYTGLNVFKTIARIVSILLHPLPAAAYLLLVLIALDATSFWVGVGWAMLTLALSIGGPAAELWLSVRARRVDDFHVALRGQRPRVLAVSLGFTALTFAAVLVGQGPRSVLVALAVGFVDGLVLTLITLNWKISLHVAGMTGATAVLWWRLGPWAAVVILVVLLVAWARLTLRRHTPAQVAAGAAVAAGVSAVVLLAIDHLLPMGAL